MFFWLMAAMITGLVLVFVGWRGRRINRNPCCRQCGFDLTGVLPAGVTCPECGAGIKLAKYVRIGQRKRLYVLVAVGLPMVVLPLMPITVVFFATMTRSDLGKLKPLTLLLWEARNLEPEDVKRAVGEIHDRQMKRLLTEGEYGRALATMTDAHRDASKPWAAGWNDVVIQARLDGRMNEAAMDGFNAGAAVMTWTCRSIVRAGAVLPLVGTLVERRLLPSVTIQSSHEIERIVVNGRVLRDVLATGPETPGTPPPDTQPLKQSILVTDDPNPWYSNGETSVRFAPTIPADLPPGDYEFEVTVASTGEVYDTSAFKTPERQVDPQPIRTTHRFQVRLVGPTDATLTLIPETTELNERIAKQLRFAARAVSERDDSKFHFTYALAGCARPLAHRAWFEAGGNRYFVGVVTSGMCVVGSLDGLDDIAMAVPDASGLYTLIVPFRVGMIEDEGTLVLEPASDIAERTTDLREIYSGRIVMQGVQLSQTADGGVVTFEPASLEKTADEPSNTEPPKPAK
jgi:hypothetical protein